MRLDNRAFGVLLLRWLIGIIFLMQGFGKVFTIGLDQVYQFFAGYEELLPSWLLHFTCYYTSFGELIFGLLLLLGLFRTPVQIGLASILVIVSFGHGLQEPIFDLQHIVFRAVLLFPLFFLPQSWDRYALDERLKKIGAKK